MGSFTEKRCGKDTTSMSAEFLSLLCQMPLLDVTHSSSQHLNQDRIRAHSHGVALHNRHMGLFGI